MGECVSAEKHTLLGEKKALRVAIEKGRLSKVRSGLERLELMGYRGKDALYVQDGMEVTAVLCAFKSGQVAVLDYFVQNGYDLSEVATAYHRLGKSPWLHLCERGLLSMLQYYLPYSLHTVIDFPVPETPSEIQAEIKRKQRIRIPAIHAAVVKGHLEVVQWLWEYFQDKFPPRELDFDAVDETYGENCALTSVRYGQISIVRYLHTTCAAEFTRLNRHKENAIQVAMVGARHFKAKQTQYMEILRFLVEELKMDVEYEYEETLLVCEDPVLYTYIEDQLRKKGIMTSKQQVETANAITAPKRPATRVMSDEIQRNADLSAIEFQIDNDVSGISMF